MELEIQPGGHLLFHKMILLDLFPWGKQKTRPKDTVIFETSITIPAVPLKLRRENQRPSSGSNKPYALTRQSREGSSPGRQPVSSFQLRSYKPTASFSRLAPTAGSLKNYLRSPLRHSFLGGPSGALHSVWHHITIISGKRSSINFSDVKKRGGRLFDEAGRAPSKSLTFGKPQPP